MQIRSVFVGLLCWQLTSFMPPDYHFQRICYNICRVLCKIFCKTKGSFPKLVFLHSLRICTPSPQNIFFLWETRLSPWLSLKLKSVIDGINFCPGQESNLGHFVLFGREIFYSFSLGLCHAYPPAIFVVH